MKKTIAVVLVYVCGLLFVGACNYDAECWAPGESTGAGVGGGVIVPGTGGGYGAEPNPEPQGDDPDALDSCGGPKKAGCHCEGRVTCGWTGPTAKNPDGSPQTAPGGWCPERFDVDLPGTCEPIKQAIFALCRDKMAGVYKSAGYGDSKQWQCWIPEITYSVWDVLRCTQK